MISHNIIFIISAPGCLQDVIRPVTDDGDTNGVENAGSKGPCSPD